MLCKMKITFSTFLLGLCLIGPVAAFPFTPQVAPVTPPEINSSAAAELLAPPASPEAEFPSLKEPAGLFGWRRDAELSGHYYMLSTLAGTLDLKFNDQFFLGRRLGLAQDALEYSLGLGFMLGFDDGGRSFFSFPLDCDARLYLAEGSLWNADPFCGLGLNLNLIGTDGSLGGTGFQLYGGLRKNFGQTVGQLDLAFGFGSRRVGNVRTLNTFFLTIGHPFML
jgi:hypothetical protein